MPGTSSAAQKSSEVILDMPPVTFSKYPNFVEKHQQKSLKSLNQQKKQNDISWKLLFEERQNAKQKKSNIEIVKVDIH